MQLLDTALSSPDKVEAILTAAAAPSSMSTFVTVTRRRRGNRERGDLSDSMQDDQDDNDMQQLSTLAESSLCISLQQDVTTCREISVLPTAKGQGIYSVQLPTVHSTDNKLSADVGNLAMETHPFDEPSPTTTSNFSAGGVPGFPDFAWTDDGTAQPSNSSKHTAVWQERRRMESILAAATPVMTKNGVQNASMRLEHQRSLRKLRKLQRKSVNLAVRGSKRHRRLLEDMEMHGKDKYSTVDHDNDEITIEWERERERSGTAKGTERYRSQCRNRRKKNHIHKVKKTVRGWRHDFHIRRFELAKNGSVDDNAKPTNTSKLGQEDFARRNRQQRALNDLQREMSYLGL